MDSLMLEGRAELRRQMIRDALDEKDPQLFQQLKDRGRLWGFRAGPREEDARGVPDGQGHG